MQLVEALLCKPEWHGFDSRRYQWDLSFPQSFRTHYDPAVDLTSERNEYQGYLLRVKAAGVSPSCPNRLEILGASNSCRPKGSRECHEMKDAYPFVNICDESQDRHSQLRLKRRLNCKISTKENVILC